METKKSTIEKVNVLKYDDAVAEANRNILNSFFKELKNSKENLPESKYDSLYIETLISFKTNINGFLKAEIRKQFIIMANEILKENRSEREQSSKEYNKEKYLTLFELYKTMCNDLMIENLTEADYLKRNIII